MIYQLLLVTLLLAFIPGQLSEKKSTIPVAATDIIYRSNDLGLSWESVSAGLPEDAWVRDLEVQGVLICSHQQGLYRSSDWGEKWELVYKKPNENQFFTLVVADSFVYFFRNVGC